MVVYDRIMNKKDELVQFHIMVPRNLKRNIKILAAKQEKSASQIVREYIEDVWRGVK